LVSKANKKGRLGVLFSLNLKVQLLFVHYVHCNFKAKTHFSSCWCCPHDESPVIVLVVLFTTYDYIIQTASKTSLCNPTKYG